MYAFKFVDLVRAKTPKVTYYTDKAKCLLMENLVDFEACFFEGKYFIKYYFNPLIASVLGGKVTQSTAEGITIIDNSGMRMTAKHPSEFENLPGSIELLWTHSEEARNQCILLERTLAKLPGNCNFPIIVGRRPSTTTSVGKENQSQAIMVRIYKFITYPKMHVVNFSRHLRFRLVV